MTKDDNILLLKQLGNVTGRRARDLSPGLGKSRAGKDDDSEVDNGLDGVPKGLNKVEGGLNVVSKARHSKGLRKTRARLPGAKETDKQVGRELLEKSLGQERNVGSEGSKKVDGH